MPQFFITKMLQLIGLTKEFCRKFWKNLYWLNSSKKYVNINGKVSKDKWQSI